jgi:5'-nucleotidase
VVEREVVTTRPLILLSNDDGHASPGIRAMYDALATCADVVLVAPETEQSATSHALTLHRPLRLRTLKTPNVKGFALDGTPADCVYVALHSEGRILPRRPDLVVSGINRGMNLGQDAFYSGTVAAAREGALRGIPAVAASAHHPGAELPRVAELATRIAMELLARAARGAQPKAPLVSVNVPDKWNGEVRATKLGQRIYEEVVEYRKDPRGREYLWLGGPGVRHERDAGTDTDAYDDGAASVTSLMLDLTQVDDHAAMLEICGKVS